MEKTKTVLKSDTSDSEQLYFEKFSKYNTNHADFSGENILVAIFWLLRHLKVLKSQSWRSEDMNSILLWNRIS